MRTENELREMFNYDIAKYHCKDCKYSHENYKGVRKYPCFDGGMHQVCGSFVPVGCDYLEWKDKNFM